MITVRFLPIAISLLLFVAPANAAAPKKVMKISQQNARLLQNIGRYSDLEVLSISCVESLRTLPDSIGTLTKLKDLILDNGNGCSMNPLLPQSIGNLHSLEKLVLYGAQDPREADEPGHQPRERHKFPASMSQLQNLIYLDLGRNGLAEVPEFVRDLPNLKELRFQWNMKFKTIPAFTVNLQELTTLRLDGNDLDDLPDFLSTLPKLTRITLGNNCKITQSAAKMKDLKRRFPKVVFDFTDEYDCPVK